MLHPDVRTARAVAVTDDPVAVADLRPVGEAHLHVPARLVGVDVERHSEGSRSETSPLEVRIRASRSEEPEASKVTSPEVASTENS